MSRGRVGGGAVAGPGDRGDQGRGRVRATRGVGDASACSCQTRAMLRRMCRVLALLPLACGPAPAGGTGEETGAAEAGPATETMEPTGSTRDPTTGCAAAGCADECSESRPCGEDWNCTAGDCVPALPQPAPCAASVTLEELLRVDLPGNARISVAGAADLEGDGVLEIFGARDQLWFVRLADLDPVPIPGPLMVGEFSTNVGDINGDDNLDLLPGTGQTVLLGDGLGGFVEAPGPDPGLIDGALGDLDGDGSDEILGFLPECPFDAPPDTECGGYNIAYWRRIGDAWQLHAVPRLVGDTFGSVFVAPALPGHAPIGVFECLDQPEIVLDDFNGQRSTFHVPKDDTAKALVAVRRSGDDRAALVRVSGGGGFTLGARMRAEEFQSWIANQWMLAPNYWHVAAGDLDLDGSDDLVLAGDGLGILLDRAAEPAAACTISIPWTERIGDLALGDLDGAGAPELILATDAGLVVFRLHITL